MLHKLTRPARIPGLGLGHVCQVIPTLFQLSLTVQWLQVFTTAKLSELTAIQLMAPASSPGLRLLATLAPWNSPDTGLYPSQPQKEMRGPVTRLAGIPNVRWINPSSSLTACTRSAKAEPSNGSGSCRRPLASTLLLACVCGLIAPQYASRTLVDSRYDTPVMSIQTAQAGDAIYRDEDLHYTGGEMSPEAR